MYYICQIINHNTIKMEQDVIDFIKSVVPVYGSTSSYQYPLPDEIVVYEDNVDYLVDLSLKNDVLEASICKGEAYLELNDLDYNILYAYLSDLLNEEIRLTKMHYEEELYNNEFSYFIK